MRVDPERAGTKQAMRLVSSATRTSLQTPLSFGAMRGADVMQLVNDVEMSAPVDRWTVEGVSVWPIVRAHVFRQLDDSFRRADASGGSLATGGNRRRQFGQTVFGAVQRGRARVVDRAHDAPHRSRVDVILFGDNLSRSEIDGVWFDRICDPVVDSCRQAGWRSLHLEPRHRYSVPRHNPSWWVQGALERAWLRARLQRGDQHHQLDGFDAVVARLPADSGLTLGLVLQRARYVRVLADWFAGVLDRSRPRVAALVDYGLESMAFALACRRAAIPSIEMQHGVQDDTHWAYARWMRLPAEGYDLLPRVYWTWTERDATRIERWASATNGWHGTVLGGNAWLDLWRSPDSALVRSHDPAVAQLAARQPGERTVLVTLQPGFADSARLRVIIEAVDRAGPSWRWWFRLHPATGTEERRRIVETVRTLVPHGEIESSSTLPLYALLRHTDVHLTATSSVVIEAEAFGVRSVLVDEIAADVFRADVDAGWAEVALTGPAIVAAMNRQPAASVERPPFSAPRDPRVVLEEVISRMPRAAERSTGS